MFGSKPVRFGVWMSGHTGAVYQECMAEHYEVDGDLLEFHNGDNVVLSVSVRNLLYFKEI